MTLDASFGTIWERVADALPDRVAISADAGDVTYREFDDRASRLAEAMRSAGVRAGDKVACYLYNGAAYLETVFAAFKLGAAPVNANYRYTGPELADLLRDADVAAVVFSGDLAANLTGVPEQVDTVRFLASVGPVDPDAGRLPAEDLESIIAATPPLTRSPRPGSDELFMYTGGTTGRPKGVIWRQADLLQSLVVPIFGPLGVDTVPASAHEIAELAVDAARDERAPVVMPVVPLMHATGLFNSMGALLVGGRVVTARPGGLDAAHTWQTVAAKGVGMIIVAGNAVCRPLVDELVAAEQRGAPHDLSILRSVLSSGTALSDGLKEMLHRRADITIIDAIASSEGGPVAFAITHSVEDLPARFYPVAAASVIDEDDQPIAPGSDAVGVLAYSGPMPIGYYKDSERTAGTFRTIGGVRHAIPGDLAQLDDDGAIRFLGRGSGVINTGGEKVHPREVEEVLLAHPHVTDVVVAGVADEVWGQRVGAVVVTSDAEVSDAELQDWVRRSLAGYKVPRVIVRAPRLQRTPTGKLEAAWAQELLRQPDASASAPAQSRTGGG